jgi:hypothetical protein
MDYSISTFVADAYFAIAFGAATRPTVDDLPGDAFAVTAAFCEDGGEEEWKQGKEWSDMHYGGQVGYETRWDVVEVKDRTH